MPADSSKALAKLSAILCEPAQGAASCKQNPSAELSGKVTCKLPGSRYSSQRHVALVGDMLIFGKKMVIAETATSLRGTTVSTDGSDVTIACGGDALATLYFRSEEVAQRWAAKMELAARGAGTMPKMLALQQQAGHADPKAASVDEVKQQILCTTELKSGTAQETPVKEVQATVVQEQLQQLRQPSLLDSMSKVGQVPWVQAASPKETAAMAEAERRRQHFEHLLRGSLELRPHRL